MGFRVECGNLMLSAHALAALQEFKDEEQDRIAKFNKMSMIAQESFDLQQREANAVPEVTIDDFKEDWQLSQFWYSDETAEILARELLAGATEDTTICIVSAPSVYAALKKFPPAEIPTKHIYLLEYDMRFKVLAGSQHFDYYDYNKPLEFRTDLKGACDRILVDPPFLEKDCQVKASLTARALLRPNSPKNSVIVCTGERMKDVIAKVYPTTKFTTFTPEHKNGLSNEFGCYASFECDSWKFA
ncbi:unnamed protein product [Kuraishia capsulata CBS 1993]|uniref:Protein-lysine N-methyltransferase EFM5 n=1 Tax=Kuraishia capsulata CBS 1993 TaxID=1382522 RepID=W6MVN4_9ASCO|nr:uncharacterized protein KUCA_T00006012001 [Kuraishia capsulata CBS 1993]CDK30017.1 unnamed protein product [Kuraishia capsulata CBS 1993]